MQGDLSNGLRQSPLFEGGENLLIKPPEGGGCMATYSAILQTIGVVFTIGNFMLNLVRHLHDIKKK